MKLLLLLLFLFTNHCLFAQDQPLWTFEANGRIYSSPVTDDNLIFFGSGDHHIYAVDKGEGILKWKFKTDGAVHSSAGISGTIVYFGSSDGSLYALDKENGDLLWSFQSGGEGMYDIWDYYLSDPVIHEDKVYWGSGDGNMYALDKVTGELQWKFETDDIIHATPVVSGNNLFFGNFNGNFYSLDIHEGSLEWKFKTIGDTYFPKGEIQKAALVEDGTVYFGSRDYNIYALDAKTGRGKWNLKTGSWVISTPFAYKDQLFFGTSDSHIFYSRNKGNGKAEWEIPVEMRVYGSAAEYKDVIYFGSFNGKMYGADYKTGDIVWEYQTETSKENYSRMFQAEGVFNDDFELYGENYLESEKTIHTLGSILSTPLITDDTIYFGSSDGKLYAVKLN